MPLTGANDLLTDIDKARREWQEALKMLDEVPPEAVEVIVYVLNAAEARYCHLLRLAKREGAVAWTTPLVDSIQHAAELSD